ncbi:MAG: hypothetical protein HYZ68_06395 [Chloroflexi bacterium]|nr:hypothetical protein [Chloroflexota bacterium]
MLVSEEGAPTTLSGDAYLHEEVAGRTYRVSARSFFQLEEPIEIVQRYADPRGDEIVLDAYSGVGVLGLSLAQRVAQVILLGHAPRRVHGRTGRGGVAHFRSSRGQRHSGPTPPGL